MADAKRSPEIRVKGGKEENLHQIMEVLEGLVAKQEETRAQGEDVAGMKETIARLSARCDELDKKLPKGSKIYQAETPTRDSAFKEFGRCFTAAWRLSKYGELEEGYQLAGSHSRAAGVPGQKTNETTAGGVLVPTLTHDAITRIIGEASIIRKLAQIIPMSSNNLTMPTKSAGPTVSWIGTEGTAASKTSVVLDNPQLSTKTLMILDEITSELDEDSIVALEPFFAAVFSEAVAEEENQQAFSSSSPFTGVVQETGVADNTLTVPGGFSNVQYNDLLALQYSIDSKLVHKGVFIMSSAAFKEIVGLTDSNGRPLFATNWANFGIETGGQDPQTARSTMLLGRPCYITDSMPTSGGANGDNTQAFAIYGDFSKFAFGDRRQMSIDFSDQVYFETGNLALRVRERVATKVLIASAFGRLMTESF